MMVIPNSSKSLLPGKCTRKIFRILYKAIKYLESSEKNGPKVIFGPFFYVVYSA